MPTTSEGAELSTAERASAKQRRGWMVLVIGVLLFLSLVLPHVTLRYVHEPGKSLLLTGFYFLHATSASFSLPVNVTQLGFGFNVIYLGIGLHEAGLICSVATFWCLWPEEIHRYLYRVLVIGGWLLLISVPFILWGWFLIDTSGVPASPGVAWLPLLLAGAIITVAARRGRDRIDNTWYAARPELM